MEIPNVLFLISLSLYIFRWLVLGITHVQLWPVGYIFSTYFYCTLEEAFSWVNLPLTLLYENSCFSTHILKNILSVKHTQKSWHMIL